MECVSSASCRTLFEIFFHCKDVIFYILLFFSDLPPPPPEAFNDPDEDEDKHVQSRTFKMLQDVVESGG